MSEPKRISRAAAMRQFRLEQERKLLGALRDAKREVGELEAANVNLRVELAAADALLGEAMDQVLGDGAGR